MLFGNPLNAHKGALRIDGPVWTVIWIQNHRPFKVVGCEGTFVHNCDSQFFFFDVKWCRSIEPNINISVFLNKQNGVLFAIKGAGAFVERGWVLWGFTELFLR